MNASKKTSVLVADDDPRLLKLVQRNLELNGYRVCTAMDGTNALKMARASIPVTGRIMKSIPFWGGVVLPGSL